MTNEKISLVEKDGGQEVEAVAYAPRGFTGEGYVYAKQDDAGRSPVPLYASPPSPHSTVDADAAIERCAALIEESIIKDTSGGKVLAPRQDGNCDGLHYATAIRALKAKSPSSDRAASEGWQPIETAPKDGTKILLCLTGYQPVVGYLDGERWEYQDCGDFAEEDHWFAWQELTGEWFPDNWMPLPAPPAIAEAKGSGQ